MSREYLVRLRMVRQDTRIIAFLRSLVDRAGNLGDRLGNGNRSVGGERSISRCTFSVLDRA